MGCPSKESSILRYQYQGIFVDNTESRNVNRLKSLSNVTNLNFREEVTSSEYYNNLIRSRTISILEVDKFEG